MHALLSPAFAQMILVGVIKTTHAVQPVCFDHHILETLLSTSMNVLVKAA